MHQHLFQGFAPNFYSYKLFQLNFEFSSFKNPGFFFVANPIWHFPWLSICSWWMLLYFSLMNNNSTSYMLTIPINLLIFPFNRNRLELLLVLVWLLQLMLLSLLATQGLTPPKPLSSRCVILFHLYMSITVMNSILNTNLFTLKF